MSRSKRQKDCLWVSRKKKKARKSDQKPSKNFVKKSVVLFPLAAKVRGSVKKVLSGKQLQLKPQSVRVQEKLKVVKARPRLRTSCLPDKKKMVANCFQATSSRIGRSIFKTNTTDLQ